MTSLNTISLSTTPNWLAETLTAIQQDGYMIIEDVLTAEQCEHISAAMYYAQDKFHQEVGLNRLERAGEKGIIRIPMKYHRVFTELLNLPPLLDIIDNTISETAILHVQNAFILPPVTAAETKHISQFNFHMDFQRVLNGYLASINALISIDEFTTENGGTVIVPASHQAMEKYTQAELQAKAVPIHCSAGSIIVFDSTLWHAAGINQSSNDRLAINLQFTRSFFKQQIDYVRALGADYIQALPERVQQLLGWYTRVVTSLDEYYQPAEKRLYRANQG